MQYSTATMKARYWNKTFKAKRKLNQNENYTTIHLAN